MLLSRLSRPHKIVVGAFAKELGHTRFFLRHKSHVYSQNPLKAGNIFQAEEDSSFPLIVCTRLSGEIVDISRWHRKSHLYWIS